MKRNFKNFIIFILAIVLLVGCKKGNNSSQAVNENTNNTSNMNNTNDKKSAEKDSNKTASKTQKNLKPVKGAIIGSLSSYVEDREVWNNFIDEKNMASAKRDDYGLHLPKILLKSKDAKKANEEIDEIEENLRKIYESGKAKMEGDDIGIYSSFSVYQDDNVLSIMIKFSDI
ncbi:hypothetical protein [Peptoniphilus obesi]|uniref:hypothetical protein n=1 Tax=Peptoniphilus obesi TaxID=1472765 RepID=UPI0004B86344|nr:hypothetical protein [Peptoniphilus obesi]